jgi:hypothetical protein
MNSLNKIKFILVISFCLLYSNPVRSQDPPGDFKVIATAGGLMPGSEVRVLYIQPNGSTTFSRYKSNDPASDTLEFKQFTLTSEQLGQIWQAIQDNGFFSLEKTYNNPKVIDGTYASLTVTANSTTYQVWTQNLAVQAFDNIITKINSIISPGYKIVYNISDIPVFEQVDVCDRSEGKSTYHYIKPLKEDPQPITQIKPGTTKNGSTTAHPGTYVACEMSLQNAVNEGIADVESKGEYWGDDICITASNFKPFTCTKAEVKIFIEFYGAEATPENARRTEIAIESMWGNKTSPDGKTFDVNVITRVSNSKTPPGTAGYHQIKLSSTETISYVSGFKTDFDLNNGVGGGSWSTTGNMLNETYAHEAGHLMGLDDHYDDYRKQPDGNWKRLNDNQIFNSSDLADQNCAKYGMTKADFQTFLDNPKTNRLTPPQVNHENDIMASLNGMPLQSAIDQIASNTSLAISIVPGDIILSNDHLEQNLTITRSEHLFLLPAETKQLPGLYGACIDARKYVPSGIFDVAPNLKYWTNFEAAGYLYKLLNYINENDLYCSNNDIYQALIWRITDNSYSNDRSIDSSLINAGINIGDKLLDFPRLTNTFDHEPGSFYIIPQELYRLELQASPGFIIDHPQNITVDTKVSVLIWDDYTSDFYWDLKKPAGSYSQLSALTGNNVNFSPDIRGIYKLKAKADFNDLMNQYAKLTTTKVIVLKDDYVETFESGKLSSSPPFAWQTSDTLGWKITDDYANSGTYSLCSGVIGDGEKSEISLDIVATENDSVSFSLKTSTEEWYDYLRFYIDDVQLVYCSGEESWWTAKCPVSKGYHNLKWIYQKHQSPGSKYKDKCWIDDIFLPISTITHINENNSIDNYKVIAFPNPVEQYLTLRYIVESKQRITVCLYDINGKLIRVLNKEFKESGIQTESYNLEGLRNGTYIIRIHNDDFSMSSNVFIVKK